MGNTNLLIILHQIFTSLMQVLDTNKLVNKFILQTKLQINSDINSKTLTKLPSYIGYIFTNN